jgi:hypothetical protein
MPRLPARVAAHTLETLGRPDLRRVCEGSCSPEPGQALFVIGPNPMQPATEVFFTIQLETDGVKVSQRQKYALAVGDPNGNPGSACAEQACVRFDSCFPQIRSLGISARSHRNIAGRRPTGVLHTRAMQLFSITVRQIEQGTL